MMSEEYIVNKMVETYWDCRNELTASMIEDLKYLKSKVTDEDLLFKIIMMI